jgi:carnitine O-acetyltransferase
MFNNCRIAKKPSDLATIYDPIKNTHIIAIRKNKFYFIDTVHNGSQLSTKEFEHQFQRVIDQAGDIKGIPLGVLTADNRDKWVDVSILFECDYQV